MPVGPSPEECPGRPAFRSVSLEQRLAPATVRKKAFVPGKVERFANGLRQAWLVADRNEWHQAVGKRPIPFTGDAGAA